MTVLTPPAAAALLDLAAAVTGNHIPDRPASPPPDPAAAARRPQPGPQPGSGSVDGAADRAAGGRPYRLRLLGEPVLYRAVDPTPIHLPRRAALQVLTLTAIHRHGLTRTQLATTIWPGIATSSATDRIDQALRSLRTATGNALPTRDAGRYRLDPDLVDVDLWHLHTTLDPAAEGGDGGRRWRRVVDAYTGELAAGHTWPWLAPHREAIRRHALDATIALAEHTPNPARRITVLQHAAAVIDPVNDDIHRRLMTAQAATGDLDGVATTWTAYTTRLAALGIRQDPQTAALADNLLHP